jgi:hypothetical protein
MSESEQNESKSIVWESYREMGEYERHFDRLEQQCRTLSSTWILAAFAAIGYLLINVSATQHDWLFSNRTLIISLIAFLSAIGIRLLWVLDRVYHQLLNACFADGLRLEDENNWLPCIRHKMVESQKNGTALPQIAAFYIGCTLTLLIISAVFLVWWLLSLDNDLASSWGVIICIIGTAAFIYVWVSTMYRGSKDLPPEHHAAYERTRSPENQRSGRCT